MKQKILLVLLFIVIDIYICNSNNPQEILRHPKWSSVDKENCGLTSADRIIGGKEAAIGQFPWIVKIGANVSPFSAVFFCGGALITPLTVLTAAHCLEKPITVVRVGEHDTTKKEDCNPHNVCAPPVQDIFTQRLIGHPNYDNETIENDIAVIILATPVKLNDFVNTICLPNLPLFSNNSYYTRGSKGEIAGWGYTNAKARTVATKLMYISVAMTDVKKCDLPEYPEIEENKQVCAGGADGQDSCDGDSGGPLVKLESAPGSSARYYVLGVVSFGLENCGLVDKPAIYTKTWHFLPWILDNMV